MTALSDQIAKTRNDILSITKVQVSGIRLPVEMIDIQKILTNQVMIMEALERIEVRLRLQ